MKFKDLASKILEKIGGDQNVSSVTHCYTRLRFNLKDDAQADTESLKNTKGVIDVVNKGGQYQVIVGTDVASIYKELVSQGNFDGDGGDNANKEDNRNKVSKVLDIIAGIFTPIIPVLAGAGMLKAIVAIIDAFSLMSADSTVYQFLAFMGDAGFYFLPVILAASAAKKFEVNQYIAMVIGGIMLHPTFISMVSQSREAGQRIDLMGLPIGLVDYSSTVIPIILAIWFMSYVESLLNRAIPKSIRIFAVPLFTILIVSIVTFIVLGPLGYYMGIGLGHVFGFLDTHVSWLVPTLVGAFTPLLVMIGMHYGLISIGINELATKGFDPVAGPGMFVSNIAQAGAAFAVAFRAKDTDLKTLASSTGFTALLGITEPVLYGVNLRYKRPLIAAMIGGTAGGLFLGIFGVGRFAQVPPGLLSLPSYIAPEGFNVLIYAIIGIIIAFIVSFIVSYVLGIEENAEEKIDEAVETVTDDQTADNVIYSPMTGKAVELTEVGDGVFSQEVVGKGVAIIPDQGKVYAPADGTVSALLDSHHAVGITTNGGAEVLIHVGIDTVQLAGRHYSPKVTQGQKLRKGDLLLEFDLEAIKQEGYEIITPVIITNPDDYLEVLGFTQKQVNPDEALIKLPSSETKEEVINNNYSIEKGSLEQ